jgi:hypothetical protein
LLVERRLEVRRGDCRGNCVDVSRLERERKVVRGGRERETGGEGTVEIYRSGGMEGRNGGWWL